ncbi:maleylacetoacetate isomerase [Bordetella flabilis]|uniref:Maleylacetoacetate isomerase n=1 Tax=Bordetella flabilis TaxID=463014 RepID=A0A193GBZ8_9BORD|nr:maleylacetoacetate isomerase [Bordetella flabilis]ANN77148.1 maleylacetoacetate isomerase [Bordetella flabilis]
MQLYSYFRSSAAYRVRIALNLKGLPYDTRPVHLLKDGGQHFLPDYTRLNPLALIPTLVDGPAVLTQSLAIIEYLEETHPIPPLLPATPIARARVRALALSIACDIHPLNNLRVLRYLKRELDIPDEARDTWYRHWIQTGLLALEKMLAASPETGTYCHGGTPSLADICLVPQLFNARRLKCDLDAMPTLVRIDAACRALPAFEHAAPENQPDAE